MGSEKPHKLGGIGLAFSDRNFRIHSIGAIASWISYFIQIIAVAWLTWELTKSTTWLAIMALMDIVPNIILLPFTGALADRFDRFKITLITNALLLVQAVAMAAFAWMDMLSIIPLALLVLIHGVLISFTVPAMWGILPRFVHKDALPSAIAVNSSYTQFAIFAGPAIAGAIITGYGILWAFIVNAGGYAILMVALVFLQTPDGFKQPKKSGHSFIIDIREGFKYILNHQGIKAILILMVAGDILMMSVYHMMPAYAENILGMGVEGVSIMFASFGLGATAAAIWLAHGGEKLISTNRILWAYLISLGAVVIMFIPSNFYIVVTGAVFFGMFSEIRKVGTFSLLQLKVTEEQRGRVMGNKYMLTQIASGIGTYAIGALAMTQGLTAPILILTATCFLIGIFFFLKRDILANNFSH